ncbi:uncharacterized protein LOC102062631 [Zonotrichia albicollis]|uniref:uncharacterized protein LOC102062631 n=1 Tax=Zonotrichia albicollis TaxID=44394 RepID=UPI003D80B801
MQRWQGCQAPTGTPLSGGRTRDPPRQHHRGSIPRRAAPRSRGTQSSAPAPREPRGRAAPRYRGSPAAEQRSALTSSANSRPAAAGPRDMTAVPGWDGAGQRIKCFIPSAPAAAPHGNAAARGGRGAQVAAGGWSVPGGIAPGGGKRQPGPSPARPGASPVRAPPAEPARGSPRSGRPGFPREPEVGFGLFAPLPPREEILPA